MRIERHHDAGAYAALVTPLLMADEPRYNLEIAIVERLAGGGSFGPDAPVLLTVDGAPALMTPPHNLLASALSPEAAVVAAGYLHAERLDVPAVLAGVATATAFAGRYTALTGLAAHVDRDQGVYALTALVEPPPVPGALRLATDDDWPVVRAWGVAFHTEVGLPLHDIDRQRARVADGLYWLWEDGGPVSMAGCGGYTPNGARIGPVYTPPDLRGRGYASAVSAGVTRDLLGRGLAWTFLYTDLGNPTSNKIYRAIGYEHVADVRAVSFGG
jgi:predicted GNAT family acetyltransferase